MTTLDKTITSPATPMSRIGPEIPEEITERNAVSTTPASTIADVVGRSAEGTAVAADEVGGGGGYRKRRNCGTAVHWQVRRQSPSKLGYSVSGY